MKTGWILGGLAPVRSARHRVALLAALCAAGAVLGAASGAQAGFQYYFDINFAQATCNGGLTCANDDTLDTFQHPRALATDYDLKFHTSTVAGQDVAYGGADDADGIGQVTLTPLRSDFIRLDSFDLIPIIAGTYDVTVNGSTYTVGPGGLTITGLPLQDDKIVWNNDTVVGIANIMGVVPEPATWATLIMGLFAVGAALRRRRPTSRVSGYA